MSTKFFVFRRTEEIGIRDCVLTSAFSGLKGAIAWISRLDLRDALKRH